MHILRRRVQRSGEVGGGQGGEGRKEGEMPTPPPKPLIVFFPGSLMPSLTPYAPMGAPFFFSPNKAAWVQPRAGCTSSDAAGMVPPPELRLLLQSTQGDTSVVCACECALIDCELYGKRREDEFCFVADNVAAVARRRWRWRRRGDRPTNALFSCPPSSLSPKQKGAPQRGSEGCNHSLHRGFMQSKSTVQRDVRVRACFVVVC